MNTPQPLPADRLSAMLGGAKNLMKKVESGDYSRGNIDESLLTQNVDSLLEAKSVPLQYQQNITQALPKQNGLPANYNTSRLAPEIKEAMLNTPPMPVWNPHHTFDLSDVSPELLEKPIPNSGYTRQPVQPQHTQPIVENYYQPQPQQIPQGMFLVNEAQLQQMIKDNMLDFMTKTFTKNLSEEVIKKTISTLIKEGKITVKKKVV